jgi:predicted XRE-type DNA-binding protein
VKEKFAKLLANGWELGSENTFADLGIELASQMKARTYLRAMIMARIDSLHLSQAEIARRTKLTQPKVSKLMSDTSTNGFSSDKLMQIATKLGLDVEIHVKTAETENGDVVIAA